MGAGSGFVFWVKKERKRKRKRKERKGNRVREFEFIALRERYLTGEALCHSWAEKSKEKKEKRKKEKEKGKKENRTKLQDLPKARSPRLTACRPYIRAATKARKGRKGKVRLL